MSDCLVIEWSECEKKVLDSDRTSKCGHGITFLLNCLSTGCFCNAVSGQQNGQKCSE